MGKRKETYLPLHWCKQVAEKLPQALGVSDVDANDLCVIANNNTDIETKLQIAKKYPNLLQMINASIHIGNIDKQGDMNAYTEIMSDIDATATLLAWSYNKQSFKIDTDFSNELIRTKNLKLTKNAWDYLPYNTFYVDLSDNAELCDMIYGKGFIIRPEKSKDNTKWYIHVCKLTDKFFFTDIITIANEDGEINIDDIPEYSNVKLMDIKQEKSGCMLDKSNTNVNTRIFSILVIQILTYLSSIEPDIHMSEKTKVTYKKPSANRPKNKFSEVQEWDVGIRFGTAYRNWKKQTESTTNRTNIGNNTKKRLHVRHAHWHHFWYGPQDGERVLRPKWVQSVFVNAINGENMPVTVHAVNRK